MLRIKLIKELMEQMNDIKKLISESSSFAIFLKENSPEQEVLCSQALTTALFLNNNNVYQFFNLPQNLKEKWGSLFLDIPNEPIPVITSVKIPASKTEVKEISYEQEDGALNLHISSIGALNTSQISVEQNQAALDLIFVFGPEAPQNIKYKNIIFISANNSTASEKVLGIIKELKISDTGNLKTVSTILLAALITETDNFTSHFNPSTLEAGKDLLEMGADKKSITAILEKTKSTPLTQLLGRAMARTRTSEDSKISWTFLSKDDFEKSGYQIAENFLLLDLMQKLRSLIPAPPMMIMLWQDEGGIEVMIKNFDNSQAAKDEILGLAQKAACPLLNDYFVMGPFKNFSEAEIQTQKMLKK